MIPKSGYRFSEKIMLQDLCDEALFQGEKCRACPGRDTDLRIEALDVVVSGLLGDIELASGFLRRVAGRVQPQDLDFAPRQTCEPQGDRTARRPARCARARLRTLA